MTNDSVTVALMRQMELTAIATYDADLDNIAKQSVILKPFHRLACVDYLGPPLRA